MPSYLASERHIELKSLGFAAAGTVDLALRVPDRDTVRVIFKDVAGAGTLKTGRLQVPVGESWTEVFFGLEGPTDERVRVEVHHPDNIERVRSVSPDQWYSVSGTTSPGTKKVGSAPPPPPPPPPEGWAGTIADEGIRKVFLHIEKHGVVTEPEVSRGRPAERQGRSACVRPRLATGRGSGSEACRPASSRPWRSTSASTARSCVRARSRCSS